MQIVLFLLVLVVWIASFFLPAVNMNAIRPGYIAALMSISVLTSIEPTAWLTHLYLGSFWIANLFMLASPFGLWRARLGKGGVFLALLAFWDVLTLSYVVYHRVTGNFASVLIGYWAWVSSLVAMTVLLFLVRRAHLRTV
jgi:hypothetical protein